MTKIDLSIYFYCFELTKESKQYTAIKHPDGSVLEYKRLPMGLKISLDATQAAMEEVLMRLLLIDVCVYINDIGIWTNWTFQAHVALVAIILEQLRKNRFKTNPLKCKWVVQITNFLGYIMMPTECKPMTKKVDALIKMAPARNKKQLRSFLGGVNFYKMMFPCSLHVL